MRTLLVTLLTLALSSGIAESQTQTPGIQLGRFTATQALNTGATNTFNSFKWALSPRPVNPNGTLYLNYDKIVNGPPPSSGCTVKLLWGATNVTGFQQTFVIAGGNLVPINPGALPFAVRIVTNNATPGISYTSITPQYQCSVYPTGGTITYEFVPDTSAEVAYNYKHINAAGSYQLQALSGGPGGLVHTIVVNNATGGGTITVFDNTTCVDSTGNQTVAVITTNVDNTFIYDIATITGTCVLVTGSEDITVTYR